MPEGAHVVAYTNDVAVVVAKHIEEIVCIANKAVENIRR